jgi:Iap family predicted aminopeptidase
MTKLLEQAVEAARALPPEMQDALVIQLTAEEESSFETSLAQADRGEYATDEQVRAIWAKHGI